jgi:hypothetical protein
VFTPKDGVFSLTAGCRPPFAAALTGGGSGVGPDISRVNSLFREKTEINKEIDLV